MTLLSFYCGSMRSDSTVILSYRIEDTVNTVLDDCLDVLKYAIEETNNSSVTLNIVAMDGNVSLRYLSSEGRVLFYREHTIDIYNTYIYSVAEEFIEYNFVDWVN